MQRYHVNPATGNVVPCESRENCLLPHYSTTDEAMRAFETKLHTSLFLATTPADPALDKALERASRYGFTRAPESVTELVEAQVSVLLTSAALSFYLSKFRSSSREGGRRKYADVISWIINEWAHREKKDYRTVLHREMEKLALTREERGLLTALDPPYLSQEELLKEAANLWLYTTSPFHHRAKQLIACKELEVSGYTPKSDYSAKRYLNYLVTKRMNIALDELPEDVLAYDVETDTERQLGLRPRRAQITEIVVANKRNSWVFAGDEKKILENFALLLNSQPTAKHLAGWNNHNFDNIVLQTRAEYHQVKGWGGKLAPAPNYTAFAPAGVGDEGQALTWTTPGGVELTDVDVFQEKVAADRAHGHRHITGLKPFVKSLGCDPITVDRTALHELSEEERAAYVLSDGVATLRAFAEVCPSQS